MRSVTPMRAAKTGYIIMSVLLCVLGVVLFVWPGVSVGRHRRAAGHRDDRVWCREGGGVSVP